MKAIGDTVCRARALIFEAAWCREHQHVARPNFRCTVSVLSGVGLCLLSGCAIWSPAIKADALGYNDVIEETTDKLLLTNVLRARDNAPLHFADIPLIHESLTATGSFQAVIPFGPQNTKSTTQQTETPGFTLQTSPSFDLATLNTKDFVTGNSSPIDPKFIKYWLDRGLDQRLVLFLFISSAEITDNSFTDGKKRVITLQNSPRTAADQLIACKKNINEPCHERTQFEHYLTLVDSINKALSVNVYSERKVIKKNFVMDVATQLRAIAALDPSKYVLEKATAATSDNTYNLFAISSEQKVAICLKQITNEGSSPRSFKYSSRRKCRTVQREPINSRM